MNRHVWASNEHAVHFSVFFLCFGSPSAVRTIGQFFFPLRWRRCQPLKKFNCFDMPWIPWVSQRPRRHLATGPNWRFFECGILKWHWWYWCKVVRLNLDAFLRMLLASIFGQYLAMLRYSRYSRLEMTRVNNMKRFTCLFPSISLVT